MLIFTRFNWCDGRPAYEIPVEKATGFHTHIGGTFFYNSDHTRCVIAPTPGAATYLSQRKYAKLIGSFQYRRNGIDHYGLN